jgi:glycosyltransferase involved in cell wall biosynthesis
VSPDSVRRDNAGVELISVVVPTRDRLASLAGCLGALAAQDAPALEVVVVDDGSADPTAVAAAVRRWRQARLVRTEARGPAAARNAGAKEARGDVICLTDDDCEPEPAWARVLAAAAEGGAAAGRTVLPAGANPPVRASQAIANHLLTASLDPVTGLAGFAPSCNLAITRSAFDRVPFDEGYPHPGGEDRDWSARAAAADLALRYEPRALVVHRQRLDLTSFLRQQFRYGRGAARFRKGGGRVGRGLARPAFYAGLVRAGFDHGRWSGALVVAAQGAAAAGIAAERVSALQQRLARQA